MTLSWSSLFFISCSSLLQLVNEQRKTGKRMSQANRLLDRSTFRSIWSAQQSSHAFATRTTPHPLRCVSTVSTSARLTSCEWRARMENTLSIDLCRNHAIVTLEVLCVKLEELFFPLAIFHRCFCSLAFLHAWQPSVNIIERHTRHLIKHNQKSPAVSMVMSVMCVKFRIS